ncbi:MAG: Uma2 family endonuclease [Pseudomonadota bacterium]
MNDLSNRPAAYSDLEKVPPHLIAEIINGELVVQPRPTFGHGGATNTLAAVLTGPFQFGQSGPGGWVFVTEPEFHFSPHVVVPKIGGWHSGRLPENIAELNSTDVAPDWLLEVLSPSTEDYDRHEKRAIYAEAGVRHLWYIDPRTKVLEVFRRQAADWLLVQTVKGSQDVTAEPFDAITFSLGLLWPFDPAPAGSKTGERRS